MNTAIGNTEVSTADKGKYVKESFRWEFDGCELLKDFENRSSGPCGVVEVFV